MKRYSVEKLARVIGAEWRGDGDAVFTGVSTDTRTIKEGDCFFAIRGANFDGHKFVAEALAKGAVCAVVTGGYEGAEDCGILRVESSVKALGQLAAEYRDRGGFKVVGITGSVGKTTTRRIIHHVLNGRFKCHQSPKNFNNDIGVPLTLLGAREDEEVLIAELGTNYPGEIRNLTHIVRPDIAVVTNVSAAHLEGFGDVGAVMDEKLSIAEGLVDGGVLFVCGDAKRIVGACREKGLDFRTFGKAEGVDVRAEGVRYSGASSRFEIEEVEVELPLAGPGNVSNALAAWAVCREMGVSAREFAERVRSLPAISMRAEILDLGPITVLNDCYNANPASMRNALDILRALGRERGGRLVFVCGDMAELGRASEELHEELGAAAAQAGVGMLIAIGKWAQVTARMAEASAKGAMETVCFADTAGACDNLEKLVRKADIVLVKGSRTSGLEACVDRLKEVFGPARSGVQV